MILKRPSLFFLNPDSCLIAGFLSSAICHSSSVCFFLHANQNISIKLQSEEPHYIRQYTCPLLANIYEGTNKQNQYNFANGVVFR